MTTNNGQLLIDKAPGMTSHDVVDRVRRVLDERRVGHAGTLDPMASGLLILGVGPSTRLLRFAQAQVKRYRGEVTLGVATDSLDADGEVVATMSVPSLDVEVVNAAARALLGEGLQRPPMVSARKVDGQRLYALARRGVEVERESRPISIDHFALSATSDPARWDFDVTCSVGTYVRVLLSDLAEGLGTVGHLSALRRVASGRHDVRDAWTLEALEAAVSEGRQVLGAPLLFVDDLTKVTGNPDVVARLRLGQRVALNVEGTGEIAVVDENGALVAVVVARGEVFKPELVMPVEMTKH
ncbi:MAG TPA: tRNA pseudouridine(55) synthase TruB [Acidimicrobiales bacterium]|nr:tRNA pseudouridine(55) synthase TruB [Acidimicrobiales bacterium]